MPLVLALAAVLAACGNGSISAATSAPLPVLTSPAQLAGYHVFVSDLLTGDVAELGVHTWHVAESIHGLELSTDGHTLFVTDVADSRLLAFTLQGNLLGAERTVAVGPQPVHVAETLDSRSIFVSNFSAQSVSVIDVASWTVRTTIAVPAAPHSILLSPDGRWVYAACYAGHAIAVIDAATAQLAATIPLPNNAEPFGLAISADGHALYASDAFTDRLYVIDTSTRQVATSVQVGLHPALIARSPDGKTLYVANGGSHSVSVVDIGADPLAPTVDPTAVQVDGYPHGIAITPDGRYVVVANTYGQNLSVIDTHTLHVVATIPAEKYPINVLITA